MDSWLETGKLIEQYKVELSWNGEDWFGTTWNSDLETNTCMHLGVNAGFAPCGCASKNVHEAVRIAVRKFLEDEYES